MKKNILLFLVGFVGVLNITFAQDYTCTSHDLYHKSVFTMTDSSDVYKCENYWMQGNIIKTKGGNDKVYISKNTKKKELKIYLGDGNDSFYHTFHNVQLRNTLIDGGNGFDTVYIKNANKEDFEINGNCSKICTIKHKKLAYLFENVTLKNIEKIVFDDTSITFDGSTSNISNTSSYPKINLSSYKYIIPAYWWSYELNKKILNFKNKTAIIIVNPSNGDFSKTESIFQDMINKTHKNNNLAIGYVYSKYGKRDLNTIKQKINNWLKYYPNINGIFIDEVSSSDSKLSFYKEIYNYIKSKNKNLVVVLNPGTIPDKGYFDIADNIVAYETYCSHYKSYSKLSWLNNYKNYQISYLGHHCSDTQKKNLYKKYGNYITYFTYDGEDGNVWDSLDLSMIDKQNSEGNKDNNSGGDNNRDNSNQQINNQNINEKLAPYSYTKFQNVLNQCKLTYPDSHTKVVDKGQFVGYKSDFFYATKDDKLVFVLKKKNLDGKIRNELRQQQNYKDSGWRIDENKIHTLTARVKLQKLNKALEYTFLQIHSEVNPLLRIVVDKEKNGKINHIWAIVRINTKSSGKRTSQYDLGEVTDNYEDFKLEIGNNRLKIYKNGKIYVDKDISYWPEKNNYFKAGIYNSKNSQALFEIKVMFDSLDMLEATENNQENNSNSNNNQNSNEGNNEENSEDINLDKVIEKLTYNNQTNEWEIKIESLKMQDKIYHNSKLNKYYPLFVKFFNNKKEKILLNEKYINSRNYNNLNFFSNYTLLLFKNLDNKNYKNVKSYVGMLKMVLINLKKIK